MAKAKQARDRRLLYVDAGFLGQVEVRDVMCIVMVVVMMMVMMDVLKKRDGREGKGREGNGEEMRERAKTRLFSVVGWRRW